MADVDTVVARLTRGAGERFTTSTANVVVTLAGESRPRSVLLRTMSSTGGGPVLTLEQATPAIGPWSAARAAVPFVSYFVGNLDAAGKRLAAQGFRRVALSERFAFWQGLGGVLVRVATTRPTQAPGPESRAGLGPIRSFTLIACDIDAVKRQLGAALGVHWKAPMPVPLPWQYGDGSGTVLVHQVHATTERSPHISVESLDPDPAQRCTPDSTPVHFVYFTQNVADAERRLAAAGMAHIGRVPGMTTYFRVADGGPFFEVGSTSFEV
ncbi:MAG: hypothetical protein HOQ24_07895, partial [Mycobacteriaceae bacterium]|nr:hypothetical protein [Mycobacteriaceae bacterium]